MNWKTRLALFVVVAAQGMGVGGQAGERRTGERSAGEARVRGINRNPRALLVVMCGSGDTGAMYDSVRRAASRAQLPIEVRRWDWGTGDIAYDIHTTRYHRLKGRQLAEQLGAVKGRDIYLLGYSAGTNVTIATVEALPKSSIRRVFLLGSGMSHAYDLRPALSRVTESIDNFFSSEDEIVESTSEVFGTGDGGPLPAAGLAGFAYSGRTGDAHLYRKMRQYSWRMTSLNGGHIDYLRAQFLDNNVIPLLKQSLATPP